MTVHPRYDLHCHSRRSVDSINTPRTLIDRARRRGLAGIAVTDHDTVAGGLETARLAPSDLLIVVGAEYYTEVGDIVGLFLEREVRSRRALEVIDEIHQQGGIAVLPHPLRSHPPIPPAVLEAVDAYEALNSRAGRFDPAAAPISKNEWTPLTGKAALASSDAHLPWEVGACCTAIPGPVSVHTLRESILAGRTQLLGKPGPERNFYISQLVKAARTRDSHLLFRGIRRVTKRLVSR